MNNNSIRGSLIGFAVADALGVPVEFSQRFLLKKKPVTEMLGYGTYDVPSGTWSDDTSMTIATMNSIIEKGDINYYDIMDKFLEWYQKAMYTATDKLFDIGGTSSLAIKNYYNRIAPTNCGPNSISSNGNGSLMRFAPFAFYIYSLNLTKNEKAQLIKEASSLTHAHEISILGCHIYCDYISQLIINKGDKLKAYKCLNENDYKQYYSSSAIDEYKRIFNKSLPKLKEEEISSSGYVRDTLEACIWCLLTTSNYEESVIKAVNLGDDTDTVGAITGSMSGMIYGEDNIPKRWLEILRKREYLENLADEYSKTLIDISTKRKRVIMEKDVDEKYYIYNNKIIAKRDMKSGIFYVLTKTNEWEVSGVFFDHYYDSESDCYEIPYSLVEERMQLQMDEHSR